MIDETDLWHRFITRSSHRVGLHAFVYNQMINYIFQGTASKFGRAESETSSSVTFSNSGSTPNGSPLGSETEEEVNDDELVK